MYKRVVRPAIWFGLETVALTKGQEAELEVVDLKILRLSFIETRMDRIRNEKIRRTTQIRFFERTLGRPD